MWGVGFEQTWVCSPCQGTGSPIIKSSYYVQTGVMISALHIQHTLGLMASTLEAIPWAKFFMWPHQSFSECSLASECRESEHKDLHSSSAVSGAQLVAVLQEYFKGNPFVPHRPI